MCVIGVIVLQMMAVQLVTSQFGGPSAFGYDASSACNKPYSRNARAYLEKIPCDFQKQNWCTVAGNFYPWHAVKRFVKENQGLMRRMYGDEKHISVIKGELDKNDLEIELDDRFGRSYDVYKSFLYEEGFELDGEDDEAFRELGGRELTETTAQEPKSTTSTTESTSRATITPKSVSSRPEMPQNISTRLTMSTTLIRSNSTVNSPQKISPINLSEIARVKNSSINEILGQIDPTQGTKFSSPSVPTTSTRPSTTSGVVTTTEKAESDDAIPGIVVEDQKFWPRPQFRPPEKGDAPKIESQLFQETLAKDKGEIPVLKLRGVNACPVKEEVVAPFWANNTRGEVLALLNLYPFEQYIHWEKCTHPKRQMHCREGCRCEQQFRLHRLLAYDPNNECRGIFSDWFKLPSCCVCRCYDLPLEFRVTSRSPRTREVKNPRRT